MKLVLSSSVGIILCLSAASHASGQQPAPSPTPEETVRVRTEEVHLTLRADGPIPGHAPKLRTNDFTIYEDGVAQAVTSLRSLPARVFVLIDTGAALTFAKQRETSDLAAQLIVGSLPEDATFAVAQYSDRVEPIIPWSSHRENAIEQLSGAAKIGRRSMLAPALHYVLESFATQPVENRHLILITDGLNGPAAVDPTSKEIKDLVAANIVVHVISLTAMEQDGAKEAAKLVRINTRRTKPRVPKEIFDEMLQSLPIANKTKEFLKLQNEAQQIVIIDLDRERRKMLKARREEWGKGEANLQKIATDSGGDVAVPIDAAALMTASIDVARAIGSHYDVMYEPSRPISDQKEAGDRSISVKSRSDALRLRLRRVLTVKR